MSEVHVDSETPTHPDNVTVLAKVRGEVVTELPKDLYIPPEALEVFLEAFEGPLDLLLYLIKKQNEDILDIEIAPITRQYMEYVELMKAVRFELAAEYLVMAAMLAEIKSRMLLPRPESEEGDEEDPRAELVRRLQEYERFKKAAEDFDVLERLNRDLYIAQVDVPKFEFDKPLPDVKLDELMRAMRNVMARAKLSAHHHVEKEVLSLRERMAQILETVKAEEFTEFSAFFSLSEGRMGVVVTFVAMLELFKSSAIEVQQAEPYSPIYLKAAA